jgi:hypothetical protein
MRRTMSLPIRISESSPISRTCASWALPLRPHPSAFQRHAPYRGL